MNSVIPKISISLAPPEDPLPDPSSPFTSLSFASNVADGDGMRPNLLTPPLTPTGLKRLVPTQDIAKWQGLDSDQFQALLNATRKRVAYIGSKKKLDLRKEVALKVYKSKQGVFS